MRSFKVWIQLSTLFFLLLNGQTLAAKETLTVREQALVQHVTESIKNATAGISKITPEVIAIPGMTSARVQHFLNNLCSSPGTTYLEVGCWKGATLISALYGNEATLADAMAVENFSQFGEPRQEFFQNLQKFVPQSSLRFFETNYFSIDKSSAFMKPITVYFYDGGHSFLEQYEAFVSFNDVFDDVFVAVVDDWNWGEVRDGTMTAFHKLGYKILYEQPFPTSGNGDRNTWWNGLYIAVIRK